jgi:PKD repeat protein
MLGWNRGRRDARGGIAAHGGTHIGGTAKIQLSLRATGHRFDRLRSGTGLALLAVLFLGATALLPASGRAVPPTTTVSFTWTPTNPSVGEAVSFISTSTVAGKNSIQRQVWDLDGDGQFDDAVGRTARTSFATPGQHVVSLRVIDVHPNHVHVHSESVTVNPVTDQPPVASFVYYPSTPVAGQPVSIYSTSTDPDSAIAALRWDLDGNGSYGDVLGPSATRSFSVPGSYRVGLQAEDTAGAASVVVRTLTVLDSSAVASLGAALRPIFPFPVVRLSGTITSTGIRVRRLTVDAPAGAGTAVKCLGRGCPFRWRRYAHDAATAAGVVRVRRLAGRFLRAGTKLQVFVRRSGAIGRYTRFTIRKRRPPARADRCLISDSPRPVSCASS